MAQPRPGTLEALAAAAPDQTVLIEHGTGRSHTRREWDDRAGSLAVALREHRGIDHGTRVALDFAHARLELFETILALAKLGAVPVHLEPRCACPSIDDALVLSEARGLVSDDPGAGRGAITVGEDYETFLGSAPDGPRPNSGVRVAPETISTSSHDPHLFHVRRDDRGDRSGLARVLGDLVQRARHRQGRSHLVAARSWLPATLLHANVTLLAGGTVVLLPDATPAVWLDAVATHEINTAVLTPEMLTAILALPAGELEAADTTSLDAVVVAGGPVPVADRLAALDLFGEDQLALLYATAEAGPVAMLDPADAAEDPGTVGTPLGGVHVTIRGEDGATLARGTTGRIHVTSPLATGEDVDTGDLGRRDEQGRLTVVGRA